jgi:hypothetical protein
MVKHRHTRKGLSKWQKRIKATARKHPHLSAPRLAKLAKKGYSKKKGHGIKRRRGVSKTLKALLRKLKR